MEDIIYDIGIIGGGPAGYTAAIRASQLGLHSIIFEKDCLGGVCLNRGCIPTKSILHCTDFYKNLKKAEKFGIIIDNAQPDYSKIFERKNSITDKIRSNLQKLIESNDVTIVNAEAKIINPSKIEANSQFYKCKNIIIATGSKPTNIKGLERDCKFILNSDDILNLNEIPENILIVGSGAIGIEWARILSALNKKVTIVEIMPALLPLADMDISKRLGQIFKKSKITYFTDTHIEKIENKKIFLSNSKEIETDIILIAAGRIPVLPISDIVIEHNNKCILTDNYNRTNVKNIYAIGDINGKMQLAHTAIHQAICTVELIAGIKEHYCKNEQIPSVVYGNPEIAWVGKTEQKLIEEMVEYKFSTFPIAALGKAQADDEIDGIIKVLSVNNKIVGAHIIAPEASALIQQFALMIDNDLSVEKISRTVFAHPTYSEGVFEAILGISGNSIHTLKAR